MRLLSGIILFGVTISSVSYAVDGTDEEVVEKEYSKKEQKVIKKRGVEAELLANLKAIKTAEIAYESNFDVFVTADPYPLKPAESPQQWVKGSSGGFATLGWYPDGAVRGSYSVTTTNIDFTAKGIGDIDGDGTMETYTATKSTNPLSKIP